MALPTMLADMGDDPLWVDTGSEQMVVPLASVDAVRRSSPDARLLSRHGTATLADGTSRSMAYVWAMAGSDRVLCRFFFL